MIKKGVAQMAQYIYGRNVVVSRLKEAKDIDEIYLLESFKDRSIVDLIKSSKIKAVWCKKNKSKSIRYYFSND